MSTTDRAVTMTRNELSTVLNLAHANEAAHLSIREQSIDHSDAFSWPAGISGRVRSYVVTLFGASDPADAGRSPMVLQFLLISGPAIEGSIDVVALTRDQPETEWARP